MTSFISFETWWGAALFIIGGISSGIGVYETAFTRALIGKGKLYMAFYSLIVALVFFGLTWWVKCESHLALLGIYFVSYYGVCITAINDVKRRG